MGNGIGHWMGAMAIDPFDSGHVIYGTGSGLWASNDVNAADKGASTHWSIPVKGLEETATSELVVPPGGKLLSALGDVGGFRHENVDVLPKDSFAPRIWSTSGIDFAQSKPNIVVRVGTHGDANTNGAYSSDSGVSWKPFDGSPVSGASGGTAAISADGGTIVWTASGQLPYVSADQGKTWKASSGLPSGTRVVADRATTGTFYALSRGTLFASTDGGKTFTARAKGLADGRIKATPGVAGDLWLTSYDGVQHSTDGGATFTKLTGVKSADGIGFGKAAPGARYQALYIVGTVNGVPGVFRSIDTGATWTRVNDDQHQFGALSGGAITGDPDVYGRVYSGSNGRGVLIGEPS